MSKKSEKTWIYERKAMQNQFNSIMGYRIPIRDIPESDGRVMYLTQDPAMYISYKNILTNGLGDSKARAVRFGMFALQMSLLNYTDFEYIETLSDDMEPWEKPFFEAMAVILECPAVENEAPALFGGYLIQALKYYVKRNYEVSKPVHEWKDPLEQLINAICQFCDVGIVKGHFTDKQAKTIFDKITPTVYKITIEGDPKKRVDMSLNVVNEMRPLWESAAKKAYNESKNAEKIEEELALFMSFFGKAFGIGSGAGEEMDAEELADIADLSKGARRETTFKRLEEEEKEEEILASEEKESSGGLPMQSDTSVEYYSDEEIDLSRAEEYDPEEDEIEVAGMDFLDRLVQSEIEIDAEKTSASEERDIPDFKEIEKKYKLKEYTCKNRFPTLTNPETAELSYNKIVKMNLGRINSCYKKLAKLFAEESEETVYRSSGKLDLERTMSSTVTSKLFTKTVDPKDKSNMAVIVAIDESGSMSGSRIERAKAAAINLAEIFGKLGIPCYVMGYTADVGADAVHDHYTTWENKKNDRIKLTSISANGNNFDGYAIRYASALLGLRPETHKVMLVISDGQPLCCAYDRSSGYSDTKDAIREARSDGQVVLGIAIGADVDVLQKMYGTDFIFITTGEDLFSGIMKKFTSMVKKW